MKNNILVLGAALVGGVVGHFVFLWLVGQGLYGLIIPGGFLGLAAGSFKSRSAAVAMVCGVLALGLGLFSEWRAFPFSADTGFGYFLAHVTQLKPVTLLMIAAGTAIGFWVPFRRREATVAA